MRDISLPYSAIPLDSLKGDRRVVLQTYCPFDLRQLTVTVKQKLYSYTEVLDTTLIIIMLKILMRVRNITMWDKNRGNIRLIMIMFGSSDSVLNFDPFFAALRGTKKMRFPWILLLQSMAPPRRLPSLPEKQATASIC